MDLQFARSMYLDLLKKCLLGFIHHDTPIATFRSTGPNLAPDQGFDLVVANISQRAICERAPFIAPTLKHDGAFVASGFLKEQQAEVVDSLTALGMRLTEDCPREDWTTLVFRAP